MTISFARGVPAPECLPVEQLADCAREAILRDGHTVLSYGSAGGYAPLREWIAARHDVEPDRVLLTNGSLQGFVFLAAHLFGGEGGHALVEAPTYDRPLKILANLGVDVTAVPQDDDGLDVAALEQELRTGPRPAFLYTIPTFQNPSGRTLTAERRQRLVELAREHDLLVLEDDPYGLVRFEGEPLPSLHELAEGARVVYASSFSKTVAPGIRVGYFILPRELVAPVEAIAVQTSITPALLGQATVWEFIRRGSFEPNVARVSDLLRARRDAMLAALEREFGTRARWSRPAGGYFVWLDLPERVRCDELLARAQAEDVTFVPGTDFFPAGSGAGADAVRLAYSFVSPEEIDTGIARLAELALGAVPA